MREMWREIAGPVILFDERSPAKTFGEQMRGIF
jgi:hypothetical protein